MMQSKKKKKSQFVHTPPNIRTQTRTHSHAHPPTDTHIPTADAHAHTTKHLTEPPRISTSPDPSPANAAPNAAPSYRVLNFDRQLPLQSVVAGRARGGKSGAPNMARAAAPLHVAALLLVGVGINRGGDRYRLYIATRGVVVVGAITYLLLGNYLVDF